jgi:hypothetical protein
LPLFAGPWCTERARKGQRSARERSPTRGLDDAGRVPPVAGESPSSAGDDRRLLPATARGHVLNRDHEPLAHGSECRFELIQAGAMSHGE